jgi:hypothetical protein
MMPRLLPTLQLMLNALLPPLQRASGETLRKSGQGAPHCSPQEFRHGVAPFLDSRGELQIFFPDCTALAAPFVLFRLKRQGFSRCTVQVSEEGLYVKGLR